MDMSMSCTIDPERQVILNNGTDNNKTNRVKTLEEQKYCLCFRHGAGLFEMTKVKTEPEELP